MKRLLVVAVLFISSMAAAQKMELVKGNLDFLKGQKEIKVEFDYSNLKAGKDDGVPESQYIADRIVELNGKSKGNGDIWKKKWNGAKDGIWQPKFLELVNKVLSKDDVDMNFQEELASTKYTLIVEVVYIFPGWDAMVMKQPAKVSTNLKFVETANKSNVLAEISSKFAPGDQYGNQYSNETRIGEGFAKTGKSLAKFILKKM